MSQSTGTGIDGGQGGHCQGWSGMGRGRENSVSGLNAFEK